MRPFLSRENRKKKKFFFFPETVYISADSGYNLITRERERELEMKLEAYISKVDAAVSSLTDGVMSLGDLPDFADGDASLCEMFEELLSPRDAVRRIMFAAGMEGALSCWSTECDFCEFEDTCPHID
jgi:hypothetical protein